MIAGSDRVYLRGVTAYRDHLAISERVDGLDQLRLRAYDGERGAHPVRARRATRRASSKQSRISRPTAYRLGYSSMVTPATVYDYHPAERPAGDAQGPGDPVRLRPVAICDRAADAPGARRQEGAGLGRLPEGLSARTAAASSILYAYGAYGYAIPPSFSTSRLSLLDRGFAYAIAHIRGGDDLGYGWFLDGKLEKRNNTFNDFVDAAKGLVAEGFASARHGSPSRAARRAAS